MNRARLLLLGFAVLAVAAGVGFGAAAARPLALAGLMTNTTADTAARATLALTFEGEAASGTLNVEPPLTGRGRLEGRLRDGWLELAGTLEGGLKIELRGVLNARDYRGTYLVSVPGEPVQYGKFQLGLAP